MSLLRAALATYRLTRLVTQDTITAPLRDALLDRTPPTRPDGSFTWTYPLTCEHCASIYAAAAVAVLSAPSPVPLPRARRFLRDVLALSGAVSIYYDYSERHESVHSWRGA